MSTTLTHLTVAYRQGPRWLDAVRDVSLSIAPGQTYGLVGESGSGKSTLALAIMRYLGPAGAILGLCISIGWIIWRKPTEPAQA